MCTVHLFLSGWGGSCEMKSFWDVTKLDSNIVSNARIVNDTPPKFNSSPPKNGAWKTRFLLGFGLFSGAMLVSERVDKGVITNQICLRGRY